MPSPSHSKTRSFAIIPTCEAGRKRERLEGGEGERERGAGAGRPGVSPHTAEEAYPRREPQEGPGMREEGDRVEGDAPGLPGAVRARWLHPSGSVLPAAR